LQVSCECWVLFRFLVSFPLKLCEESPTTIVAQFCQVHGSFSADAGGDLLRFVELCQFVIQFANFQAHSLWNCCVEGIWVSRGKGQGHIVQASAPNFADVQVDQDDTFLIMVTI